jgi:hypothetical protein
VRLVREKAITNNKDLSERDICTKCIKTATEDLGDLAALLAKLEGERGGNGETPRPPKSNRQ